MLRQRSIRPLLNFIILLCVATFLIVISRSLWEPDVPQEFQCALAPAVGINWKGCRFENKNLQQAILTNATLSLAKFTHSTLQAADLTNVEAEYTDFSYADLSYADLSSGKFKGADFRQADLSSAKLTGADMSYADLTGAKLGGAVFDGVTLDRAVWLNGNVCVAGSVGRCLVRKK
jgi:uncharacterized protein YjbI with pentapeptide repeats